MIERDRPAPEAFLAAVRAEGRGRLKVFLGAAPGVGKTYEMLSDANARLKDGIDVVIGIVETHGRAETEAMVRPITVLPRREIDYDGRRLTEMDLDAILARKPRLVLVDELAHTNAPGSRHPKRWQDIEELLAAAIDVFTTVNIQHIESLNDVVASFTRVRVRETVPDRVLEDADIEVVDLPPDELIERLKQGKVYVPDEASRALGHFFSRSNLTALRELALRRAAQAVDAQMLVDLRAAALGGVYAAGERVLVAVSELPSAPELVRAAKRLADALKAPWTALHIETRRAASLTASERQRLADTLTLATSLGAETASIPAASVVEGLTAYAAEARATQIVIGKSRRSRLFELRHGSVVDRLVRGVDGVAVHVLPTAVGPAPTGPPEANAARPRGDTQATPAAYARAVALVALATGLGVLLVNVVGRHGTALLYMLPVMAAAMRGGLKPGLLAGVLSALAFNFFFLPPLYSFTIADPANAVTIIVLLAVAFLTSQLAARVRAQAELAATSARQNAALAGFARQLGAIATETELGQALSGECARLFDAHAIFLMPREGTLAIVAAVPPETRLNDVARAAAEWVIDRGQTAGRGSDTLPAADWLFVPVMAGGGARAVLGLTRDDGREPVRADRRSTLAALAEQSGLALARIRSEADLGQVARLEERDKLRAALLASISHDLRTPLTTILASAREIAARSPVDPAASALESEALRLQRFIANLLDMARVEAGALSLALEPTDLVDAVASAAQDARAALAGHPITLDVPPDLPLVLADPRLLHHCLLNLLDNAGKFAKPGTPVLVSAARTSAGLTLSVVDEGPGLPPGTEQHVWETFTRLQGSDRERTGTGLGLAIVKGFAEAMGFAVSAANRADLSGAHFRVNIPERAIVRAQPSLAA